MGHNEEEREKKLKNCQHYVSTEESQGNSVNLQGLAITEEIELLCVSFKQGHGLTDHLHPRNRN